MGNKKLEPDEIYRPTIWPGCHPYIAQAIEIFFGRWRPYSDKSDRYFIFELFTEVIDPQFHAFINELSGGHPAKNICEKMKLGEFARLNGFWKLEDWIIEVIRSCDTLSRSKKPSSNSFANFKDTGLVKITGSADKYFFGTFETMRDLASDCYRKKSDKLSGGKLTEVKNLNMRRANPHCSYCGEPSELARFQLDIKISDAINNPIFENARLSGRYCAAHRPNLYDGTLNPRYRFATRHKTQFENEFLRLRRQSSTWSEPVCASGDQHIDNFVFHFMYEHSLFPDEERKIRNLACNLTTHKITDAKKKIIMRLAEGETQSDIARDLNVHRQALSRMLNCIPDQYRFDRAEKFRTR